MADPTGSINVWAEVWEAVKSLSVLIIGLLAWLGKRQVGRIDKLEESQSKMMTRDEFNGAISGIRSDISAGMERVATEIRHQSNRIDGLYKSGTKDDK